MVFRTYIGVSCGHLIINKLFSCFRLSFLIVMMSLVAACSSGGGDDSDNTTTYYQDSDGDGYGDSASPQSATSQPAGYVTNKTDCDDSSAAINPAAAEANDGIDNNCDGQVDEASITYYQDADSDGYGNPAVTQVSTSPPAGYVTNSIDCNDSDAAVHPDATEITDGVDNDCNGQIDEGFIPSSLIWDQGNWDTSNWN